MTATIGSSPAEGLVEVDGQEHYRISAVDRIPPFLMSLASDGDRWSFASSAGPLTAGRRDAAHALFPYETDDRLHEAVGRIGPVTTVRVGDRIWRPFRDRHPDDRSLLKSVVGDSLILEEWDASSGLLLRTQWSSCDRFGFVRTSTLVNHGTRPQHVELIDGLVDVLPDGLAPATYRQMRNLTHAYKRNELVAPRVAVFSLESPVSDRPEPEEVLRATVVWSLGLDGAEVLLDATALEAFEDGAALAPAPLVTGRPGSYLLRGRSSLDPGEEVRWRIVADVARDQADLVEVTSLLRSEPALDRVIEAELRASGNRLRTIMAGADALQLTGDPVACAHHFANVTYNSMRGGVPLMGYRIDSADLSAFVEERDRRVSSRHTTWLATLPNVVDRRDLLDGARATGDAHLARLVQEYLPFSFSRRHGDPSRPWNEFSIRIHREDGAPVVYFEGNWRDLFQNWEALCASFPDYLPGVVSLFVNASTPDGHNPYRISRDGIDWEVPEPGNPWSNIGYWGDHQLVYLLRLLDATEAHRPGTIARMLGERCHTSADVPYRLVGYDELVRDPKATIRFDTDAAAAAAERVAHIGADGKLVADPTGEPVVMTLLEKLLVSSLAKLSNFVPGGGIWMNTQRPEWNDANNALVGHGLSIVTLCHLRQFLTRVRDLVADGPAQVEVAREVSSWLHDVSTSLDALPTRAAAGEEARHRRSVMDRLGRAASAYRAGIYRSGFSGERAVVTREQVAHLCDVAIAHVDETIHQARRPDGLYHAYNLIRLTPDGSEAHVDHLPEMLEGQVAVLGSGVLGSEEQADLLDALFASAMYRPDQRSFMLSPPWPRPSFLDKGIVPPEAARSNPLLQRLLDTGDRSVVRLDAHGTCRFHPDLTDARQLAGVLDRLATDDELAPLVAAHGRETLDLYEDVFRHHAFIGRSGSMYAYEGIGSIYWHMVTKLLLAVQEAAVAAARSGQPDVVVGRLVDCYWRTRAGLGVSKTAAEFGAIPIDPYSHTPAGAGAQQPGMTGAVKEEILTRRLELGVRVEHGEIVFDPLLLRPAELLEEERRWSYTDVSGSAAECRLPAGTVGLTVCQVPVVVGAGAGDGEIEVHLHDGRVVRRSGSRLGSDLSSEVFGRTGQVVRIHATVPLRHLVGGHA